jgi:hypothetical protein
MSKTILDVTVYVFTAIIRIASIKPLVCYDSYTLPEMWCFKNFSDTSTGLAEIRV